MSLAAALLPAAAAADIRIGVAGDFSGSFAALGEQMRRGAGAAVADLNAAGGVLGETVVLLDGDDRCDRNEADAVANRMTGAGIVMMVGHLCSQPSIEASKVYAEQGIVQISPSAGHPAFTDAAPGPGVFRLAPRDDAQGRVAGRLLADRFADVPVAIVHDGEAYGEALAEATRRAMNDAGKVEALSEAFDSRNRDYTELVARLKAFGIGAVFVGAKHLTAGLIAAEMAAQGLDAALVSGDALATDRFLEAAGPAGEGALFTLPPDPLANPHAADAVDRLAAGGAVPEGFVLPAYAAVEVWAQAAEAAGSFDAEAVAAALAEGRFATVLGPLGFDDKGDVDLPGFVVHAWREDRYVPDPAP